MTNTNSQSGMDRPNSALRFGFVIRHWSFVILPLILLSCSTPAQKYPAHWWTQVSKDGAPTWEILPQEAGPGEVILSKRHELGLLSNFAPTSFTFRGKRYASVEGF